MEKNPIFLQKIFFRINKGLILGKKG